MWSSLPSSHLFVCFTADLVGVSHYLNLLRILEDTAANTTLLCTSCESYMSECTVRCSRNCESVNACNLFHRAYELIRRESSFKVMPRHREPTPDNGKKCRKKKRAERVKSSTRSDTLVSSPTRQRRKIYEGWGRVGVGGGGWGTSVGSTISPTPTPHLHAPPPPS